MSSQFVQPLEERKLFASQAWLLGPVDTRPDAPRPITGFTASLQAETARSIDAAKSTNAKNLARNGKKGKNNVPVRSTNMVGEWHGKMEVDYHWNEDWEYDFDLSVYSQTSNSIYARVEIDGVDFVGTFFGSINPKNGRFRYTLDDHDDEVTIEGQLSKKAKHIGDGDIEVECWHGYWEWEQDGEYQVRRIA